MADRKNRIGRTPITRARRPIQPIRPGEPGRPVKPVRPGPVVGPGGPIQPVRPPGTRPTEPTDPVLQPDPRPRPTPEPRPTPQPRPTPVDADRSFARVLSTRDKDKIVPDVVQRLETGRQRFVAESVIAAERELQILQAEQTRLNEEGDETGRKQQRLTRLVSVVEVDLGGHRFTGEAVKRMAEPIKGGWTVVGRALDQQGRPLPDATLLFQDASGQAVGALGSVKLDDDGMVRHVYEPDVVAGLAEQGVRVGAVIRVGRRNVAVDKAKVRVGPNRTYQFELRLERPVG